MTTTGLEVFDKTIHKTNEWLGSVMHAIPTEDRREAYVLLRAVLHALRDRLPLATAVGLGAQLPLLLRGTFYESWNPGEGGAPLHLTSEQEFLDAVEEKTSPGTDVDAATKAVLRVLEMRLDANETDKLLRVLPRPVRDLWRRPLDPRDE